MANNDEREFRLRASAYKIPMHHPRMSASRKRQSVGPGAGPKRARLYKQRRAVRIVHANTTVAGQWRRPWALRRP